MFVNHTISSALFQAFTANLVAAATIVFLFSRLIRSRFVRVRRRVSRSRSEQAYIKKNNQPQGYS